MKVNRNIITIIGLVLIVTIAFSFNSCETFIKSNKKENAKISKIQANILTDKGEAKLLVMASQDNLDVIELCNIIENNKINDSVRDLVQDLKEEHIEILEDYNKIAINNIISIPNYSNIKDENKLITNKSTVNQLNTLKNKINNQIEILDMLSESANNIEFRELAENTNNTLEQSLDRTKQTINTLQ